ncbi:hypothetical protein B7755_033045 [Streptomyces sp. NBS 14/10]|uniref:hypothetical protein n=1 Tax=Streptomyces sp. NBS 14/10 TaxID=1945643 RepID=UPI000B7D414F|nr:hypothetical protein [Streptomyces sp. NBS 14/10]KAK1182535.1 hypothetical protein B7755_033045 [Streptomyces sp. NBS 14/10]
MTFEDEWSKLRTDAAAGRKSTHMQLNQTDPPGPSLPGTLTLKSSASKKKSAVNALTTDVEPDTKKAGECVDETTEKAEKEFKDWATGSGLTEALKGWHTSVKALQARLSQEKSALSGTNKYFLGNDFQVGSELTTAVPPAQYSDNTPFSSRISDYYR